jgi:hypothetical protein
MQQLLLLLRPPMHQHLREHRQHQQHCRLARKGQQRWRCCRKLCSAPVMHAAVGWGACCCLQQRGAVDNAWVLFAGQLHVRQDRLQVVPASISHTRKHICTVKPCLTYNQHSEHY